MKRFVVLGLFGMASLLSYPSLSYSQDEKSASATFFRFLDSNNYYRERIDEGKIIQSVRAHFDTSAYRQIRIAVMNDEAGTPYIILQLLSKKYHRVDIARMNVNNQFDVTSVLKNYK